MKKLLNDIEAIDKILRTEKDKPVWTTKYNLLCLLNCKEDMLRYGPARRRWEGDGSGEKIFRELNLYLQVSILIGN